MVGHNAKSITWIIKACDAMTIIFCLHITIAETILKAFMQVLEGNEKCF